jgi:hypothetical protein
MVDRHVNAVRHKPVDAGIRPARLGWSSTLLPLDIHSEFDVSARAARTIACLLNRNSAMTMLKLDVGDEPLMKYLRASAEATGRTVEQVAIQAIRNGVRLDKEGLLALADKARSLQPSPVEDDSTEIIRRMRDAS